MNEELDDYKAEVIPDMKATLEWQRDLVFTATTQRGYDLDFDANIQWGCMPVEGLVMSLAGCMAIDVVSILGKMRCPPESFTMDISATRHPTPPQRITKVVMKLHLKGDVPSDKVERAISLSEEKYCSVTHSLREDIEIVTEFDVESGE
jgi:putative redox protein